MSDWWGRKVIQAVCRIAGDAYEWEQRRMLIDRPWEEDFLHWVREQDAWRLHGHLTPPRGRRRCTTSSGWCPGQSRRATRRPAGERPR